MNNKNLEDHIKHTELQISKTRRKILNAIGVLQSLIYSQAYNYDILKETFKGKTYSIAGVILNEQPCIVKKRHQIYNSLRKRNVVDKAFCEDLDIIIKPLRKKSKSKPVLKFNNNALRVAEMNSKIRSTSMMTSSERTILKDLIKEISEELESE